MDEVRRGELEQGIIEALAEACHEAWRTVRARQGWIYGDPRDDVKKKHPLMLPYRELQESDKEANRTPARVVRAKLAEIGYAIERAGAGDDGVSGETSLSPDHRKKLVMIEHDIWLRDHLLRGYQWADVTETDELLRRHRDVAPFGEVLDEDKELDYAIADSISGVVHSHGYRLVDTREPDTGGEARGPAG
jgi:hypothetical protein